MTEPAKCTSHSKRILFGTTVGLSAMALLRGQLAWFREQGWDVKLVTSPDSEAKRAAKRERISLVGVSMKRNISLAHDLKSLIEWLRLIRRVRPQVVNLGTPKASLLGSFAAWFCRVPRRLYTVRGLRLQGVSGFMAKLLWLMERLTIKMATDVVVVSPSLGKELVAHGLAASEDLWIIGSGSSNGVDVPAIQKRIASVDKNRLRHHLSINPTSFVVGYIGRVSSSKGVDTLLSAIGNQQLLNDVELLIVGTIEDAKLGKAIEELGERVHLVPWTDDVWGYLPAMDILCLPTHREGFPNTILEAAAAGIPAITTKATGAVDSVIDKETGYLVDIGDDEVLTHRIESLSTNSKLLAQLGANAKKRAETQFKPHEIWTGIEAIAEGRTDIAHLKRLSQYLESSDTK